MLLKSNDEVIVLSGKEKGKRGKISSTLPKKRMVIVEGINVVTRHTKPQAQGQPGSLIKKEAPMHACKVMIVCGKCQKPTKIGKKFLEDGKKARYCKKCGETL